MTDSSPDPTRSDTTDAAELRGEGLGVRAIIGGLLMGLANLVPGISGGTMLLAVGVYPQFIGGIAEVSTFRFRARTILTLGCIVGAALFAVVAFAAPISSLVVSHRWAMYSVFIGLTLGGVPLLWSMLKPADSTVVVASIVGIALMALLTLVEPGGASDGGGNTKAYALLFLAGVAGASAMVLPGVSGAYLLLILGQYVVILSAISAAKQGVIDGDWAAVLDTMHVVIPVGLGVVVGVVGISNLVKMLLARFERATLGFLLGLLLGAVLGLWPFQEGLAPEVGSAFRGDTVAIVDDTLVMATTGREIEPADYPLVYVSPTVGRSLGVLALIAAGFAASWGISRLGAAKNGDSTA